MTLVYNYHPETKHYLWTSDAEYSPKEFNVLLIPAHATSIEPPICEENQIVVFDEESQSWKVIDKLLEEYKKEINDDFKTYTPTEGFFPELTEEQKADFEKRKAEWEKIQSEKTEILLKLGLTKEDAQKLLVF